MKQESESSVVRKPLYYHSESDLYREMLGQRWEWAITPLFTELFSSPSFRFHRSFYGNMIEEMWNHPELARESGYKDTEILASIAVMQEITTGFGFILGKEIQNLHSTNEGIQNIDAASKYAPWNELKSFAQSEANIGHVNGIVYGSIDPPHLGHARMLTQVWPHCHNLFVGFDRNSVISTRKGTPEDPRPRFPQLAWRMWEVASLPTVDKVFVLPVTEQTEEAYLQMCADLRITVMGTSEDNVYLDKYQRMMKKLGGTVVVKDREWSSTDLVAELAKPSIYPFDRSESLQQWATEQEAQARSFGFLRDYPEGT